MLCAPRELLTFGSEHFQAGLEGNFIEATTGMIDFGNDVNLTLLKSYIELALVVWSLRNVQILRECLDVVFHFPLKNVLSCSKVGDQFLNSIVCKLCAMKIILGILNVTKYLLDENEAFASKTARLYEILFEHKELLKSVSNGKLERLQHTLVKMFASVTSMAFRPSLRELMGITQHSERKCFLHACQVL